MTRIEINDFSLKGFTALLNYIYSGDKKIITKIKVLKELFEIYNMAEKYFLTELKTLVSTTMKNFPFSVQNYAAVFTTVAKYENLLHTEEMCQDLLQRCAAAVKKSWRTVDDSTSFWSADYNDDASLKAALFQKISTLSSRPCHTQKDLKNPFLMLGKHVRATCHLVSTEGDFIPLGSRGFVMEHNKTTPSSQECWAVRWNHLKTHSTHLDLKCIEPVPVLTLGWPPY